MASLYDKNRQRKYLNAQERQQFKNCVDAITDQRKRAFLWALIETGGRISEVLNLRVSDVDSTESCFVFDTLKQRDNFLPRVAIIRPELLNLLRTIIDNEKLSPDEKIWTICRETGWRWVKHSMAQANITGSKATPKGLRHSFAVGCSRSGLSIPDIQVLMGHSSPITTSIYLAVMPEELRELIIKSLPT